jgi:hypothetical protein
VKICVAVAGSSSEGSKKVAKKRSKKCPKKPKSLVKQGFLA